MVMSVMNNTTAVNAQRNLSKTQGALSGTLQRLSSGLRINSAADDAAGLAISEKFRSDIRGYSQSERNAMDGMSMMQTAEGAMNESGGILTRMKELAVQSSNGTLGASERGYIQNEFTQLSSEIDRIANVTEFNGTKLLDGSNASVTFQVGINNTANDKISATFTDMRAASLGVDTGTVDLSTQAGAQSALTTIDTAFATVASGRATLGAVQNRLQVTVNNLGSARENITSAESRIRDADIAQETSAMSRGQVLSQAGIAVLSQANQIPSMALSLLR